MAASYIILPEIELIISQVSGDFDDEIARELHVNLVPSGKFINYNRLSDVREVKANTVSHDSVKRFAKLISGTKQKRAFVFKRLTEVGIYNQIKSYAERPSDKFLVTDSMDEAIKWLGLGGVNDLILRHLDK